MSSNPSAGVFAEVSGKCVSEYLRQVTIVSHAGMLESRGIPSRYCFQ